MNDENKIGLSIEMYEGLKETLVKAVKSTKANAGLENAQPVSYTHLYRYGYKTGCSKCVGVEFVLSINLYKFATDICG